MIFVQPSIRTFMFSGGGLNLNPSGLAESSSRRHTVPGTGNLTTFFGRERRSQRSSIGRSDGPIFPVSNTSQNTCSLTFPAPFSASIQHLKTPYVHELEPQRPAAGGPRHDVAGRLRRKSRREALQHHRSQPGESRDRHRSRTDAGSAPTTRLLTIGAALHHQLPGLGTGGPASRTSASSIRSAISRASIYHGLQVTLTKRYSKGLYWLAGYTYAHAIDTAGATTNLADVPQNSLNFDAENASGDYDIRHRFTFSATYELPGVKSPLQLLQGWQITSLVHAPERLSHRLLRCSAPTSPAPAKASTTPATIAGTFSATRKNIKWSQNAAHDSVPRTGDSASRCHAAANTPALQDSLN